MRHGNKGRKLGRTHSHRASTMAGLATSLFLHKRIKTTEAKAKEMRRYVEPIITRAKRSLALKGEDVKVAAARVHARREIGKVIKDEAAIKALFTEIAPRVAERAGGYTRVVKMGYRRGDNADIAMIELVDWNSGEETTAAPATRMATPRPTRNKANTAEAKLAEAEAPAEAAPKKPRATRKKKTTEE